MLPFSKRSQPLRDAYSYEVPQNVRARVWHNLEQTVNDGMYVGGHDFTSSLLAVRELCLQNYGGLANAMEVRNARSETERMYYHCLLCEDKQYLDFLEFFFQVHYGAYANSCVPVVNQVFREEGIGYEFTELSEEEDGPGMHFGRPMGRKIKRTFPQVIRKSDETLHTTVVQPALVALGRPEFDVANQELLKAHDAYRRGAFPDVLTHAGSALESVFKTICSKKNWTYKPDSDTLMSLVTTCHANGLFPPFYTEVFKDVGTIRNKFSSSHGRATTSNPAVTQEYADHMVQLVSSHVTLLIRLAKL
jgi:hypothetical protein